jgi:RNA recognition motif-containing protein
MQRLAFVFSAILLSVVMFCFSIEPAMASIITMPSPPVATIYVDNLKSDVTESDLKELFTTYFPDDEFKVIIPLGKTGQSMGFGFVNTADPRSDNKLINDLPKDLRYEGQGQWAGQSLSFRNIPISQSDDEIASFNGIDSCSQCESVLKRCAVGIKNQIKICLNEPQYASCNECANKVSEIAKGENLKCMRFVPYQQAMCEASCRMKMVSPSFRRGVCDTENLDCICY